jgi:hypothetical protein
MTDPATTDYDYKAFLTKYHKTHPPKEKQNYADVTKAFVKWLQRKIKAKLGNSKQLTMLFKNSNLAGRVESLVNRFIVLPAMLLLNEYQAQEVHDIIFAKPDTKEEYVLLAIYRDKELKDEWKKPANRTILAQTVAYAVLVLGELIEKNIAEFVDLMFYKKGDFTIGTACYNAMLKTLSMTDEQIKAIDVKTIIDSLNTA